MPYTPKLAFLVDGVARVWGWADKVELSAGLWPNVVPFRCPVHEFGKLQGNLNRTGTLELYLSDPDTPDVEFDGWSVDHVEDAPPATLLGAESPSVTEKVIYLTDRRWEFCDGRGGHVFWGTVNAATPDGTGVSNPPGGPFLEAGEDSYHILNALRGAIQYASGLSAMPALSEVGPWIGHYARDLACDGAHAPTVMQQVLEQLEAVWLLNTDAAYAIQPIGEGDSPTIDAGLLLASDSNYGRSVRPATLVITSAPTRALRQETMLGPGNGSWQFVGREADGSLAKLPDLSYCAGKTAANLVIDNYAPLTGEDRELAWSSLYTIVALVADRDTKLPVAMRAAITVADDATGSDRALGVRVRAKVARQGADGLWVNSTTLVEVSGFEVDAVHGVLYFQDVLGKVDADGVEDFQSHFVPLAPDDLEVTFAHESRARDETDYFTVAYTLDANFDVVETDASDALAPTAKDVKVIRLPELRELRDAAGDSLNDTELKAAAQKVAARILSEPSAVKTYTYIGFHDVSPNGNIPAVTWDLRRCVTTFDYRTYYIGRNRYMDKALLWGQATAARQAAVQASNAPRQAAAGTGGYAQPLQATPGRVAAPSSGGGEFWGKITGNAADGDNRYKYAWSEVYKSAAGYGGWAVKSGGRSGTTSTNPARNVIENPNAATGTQGNGVDVANLLGTFALKPCPANAIVRMSAVRFDNDGTMTTEYWFAHENAIDGECE